MLNRKSSISAIFLYLQLWVVYCKKKYRMTYFNVLNIVREGEIKNPAETMGVGEELFDVSKIDLEKHTGNDSHFIVEVDYERKMNGNSQFRIKVKTTWLIVGLDKEKEDREFFTLQTLIMRSVSHLFGELACTYQDNNWLMMLPHNEPNYSKSFEFAKNLLKEFFKAK